MSFNVGPVGSHASQSGALSVQSHQLYRFLEVFGEKLVALSHLCGARSEFLAAAAHQVKEVHIGFGGLHVFEEQLHGFDLVHVVDELAQNSGFLQNFGRQQEFLAACAASVELDGGEDALFIKATIQVDLTVAGAFEFLKDHLVHARARVDQGGGNDGERATFFDLSRSAKKPLGSLQCVGVDTAGEHFA